MGQLKAIWDTLRAFIVATIFIGFFNILLGGLVVGSADGQIDTLGSFSDLILEVGPINYLLIVLLSVATTHFLYILYSKKVSKMEMTPFKRENISIESLIGTIMAFVAFSMVMLLMWISGIVSFTGTNLSIEIIIPLALSIQAAYSEELVFRGILYRRLHSIQGHIFALFLTSSIFGFLHIVNPGATLLSSINIMITAGVILGVGYAISGRIWFSFFFHFMWNFTQGAIYGQPISGIEVRGLLASETSGINILTGGEFGPEASIFTTLVLLPLSIISLYILFSDKNYKYDFFRYLD